MKFILKKDINRNLIMREVMKINKNIFNYDGLFFSNISRVYKTFFIINSLLNITTIIHIKNSQILNVDQINLYLKTLNIIKNNWKHLIFLSSLF